VTAFGPDEAWAVGAAGTVIHLARGAVTRYTLASRAWLRAVAGSGPDDVWIGGDGGTLLHYDGRDFHAVSHPLGARAALTGIAVSRGALWAVGPSGDRLQPFAGSEASSLAGRMWNRSLDKARALERFGARVAGSPAEAVGGAERVHIVLSDDATVDAVLEQAAPAIGKGALVLDHTTVSPAGNRGDRRRARRGGRARRGARGRARALHEAVDRWGAGGRPMGRRRSADGAPEVGRWGAGGRTMGRRRSDDG